MNQIPKGTFTITMEINNATYQLVYLQNLSSILQMCSIVVSDFPSLHYPIHGYYQIQWTWGQFQFQWPLIEQQRNVIVTNPFNILQDYAEASNQLDKQS